MTPADRNEFRGETKKGCMHVAWYKWDTILVRLLQFGSSKAYVDEPSLNVDDC